MLGRWVYRWGTRIVLPLVFGYFYWRGRRESGYRAFWAERCGRGGAMPVASIWVHAASVGEIVLVTPLIEALLARGETLLLTTMTPTGRAQVADRFGDRLCCRYVPLDTPGATARFINAAQPRLAVFAETELWPNLIAAVDRARTPLLILNASISERSAVRYQRWPIAGLVADALRRVSGVGAASAVHAERFLALGVERARVEITGNLKYDGEVAVDTTHQRGSLRAAWQAESRPIWVAASTHDGEEAIVLDVFARLRACHPRLLLVLAPRHPQRFSLVAALVASRGWRYRRRSTGAPVDHDTDIVLADTLGEVPLFYVAADMAFVGGSLVPGVNGHNVVECAARARPLCVGPYVREWQAVVDALAASGAAAVCATPDALAKQLATWLADPASAATAGRAGRAVIEAGRGALQASLALIDRTLAACGR